MCSVLAHELRSPLSVLQGYVRLLQRQREPGHPEAAMLEAMLEATGRLTTLARQASDLGNWLSGAQRAPLPAVDTSAMVEALAEHVRGDAAIDFVRPATPPVRGSVRADPIVAAGAIAAIAASLQRDHDDSVIEILLVHPPADAAVAFVLRPRADTTTLAARTGPARAFSFDRGGAGLALIAASHVLDTHNASVEAADTPGGLSIRFPHAGGAH
jgi:hypothetical protein